MAAINTTLVSAILNATLPTNATAGEPTPAGSTTLGLSTGVMQINLTSSTNATGSGTELANGNGYTTHGIAFGHSGTASSAGSSVSLPAAGDASVFVWTNSSGGWTIYGLNIISSAFVQAWYGNFNGFPITVAAGNSFQIATSAITVSLT